MKVRDAMHKGVEWVSPDTSVIELAKLMCGHDIGAVPIGEDDQLIGMVTDRDIVCRGLAGHNFDAGRATARDVAHGETPGPQVAGDERKQTNGRHPQFGRHQPFGPRSYAVRMHEERFGPSPLRHAGFAARPG